MMWSLSALPHLCVFTTLMTTVLSQKMLILENGSQFIKAGMSTDPEPRVIRNVMTDPLVSSGSPVYGDQALLVQSEDSLIFPTFVGIVDSWDEEEQIWKFVITDVLGELPGAQPVLLVAQTNARDYHIAGMRNAMRDLGARGVLVRSEADLIMRAMEMETGIVLVSGAEVTDAVAVVNGRVFRNSYTASYIAGDAVTYELELYVNDEDDLDLFGVEALKIEHCYVALDFNEELRKDPASTIFIVDQAPFMAPEILFGLEESGPEMTVQELVASAYFAAPASARDTLLQNVVIAGGNTLLRGFPERLKKELEQMFYVDVTIHAPDNRRFLAWYGGQKMVNEI